MLVVDGARVGVGEDAVLIHEGKRGAGEEGERG